MHQYKILLVDDEQFIVESYGEMLKSLGYKVIAETSSKKALEAFQAQPEKFDLVLTDYTMPEMTGVEFLKKAGTEEVLSLDPPYRPTRGSSCMVFRRWFEAGGTA